MREIALEIPTTPGDPEPLRLTAKSGFQLFIVGPNGSGKSALLQLFVNQICRDGGHEKIKWLTAHRQTWFDSGGTEFTPQVRQEYEVGTQNNHRTNEARWKDLGTHDNLSAIIFDLFAGENSRAREIALHVDNDETVKARATSTARPSPFNQLNELLHDCDLKVTIIHSNDQFLYTKYSQDEQYSVTEMSDGERGALILAAHVVTAEPGTVFVIDEPEKHLHQSILHGFLSSLFERRKADCAFIIATHEITLPVAIPDSQVLILRSCEWTDNYCAAWKAQLLDGDYQIPDDLKLAILGSRNRILFVEGEAHSLDYALYTTLFPNLTVVPQGSCDEVQKAVRGLRESHEMHHVEAFGLIDRDDRDDEQVDKLAEDCIFALEVYSVEALYYSCAAIDAVARRQAESQGVDANQLIALTIEKALETLQDRGIPERMAEIKRKRRLRESTLSLSSDWESVNNNLSQPVSSFFNLPSCSEEINIFNKLVEKEEFDALVANYPLRRSRAFQKIATSLGCDKRKTYERIVRTQVRNDPRLAKSLKNRIHPLSKALESDDAS